MKVLSEIKNYPCGDYRVTYADGHNYKVSYGKPTVNVKAEFLEEQIRTTPPIEEEEKNEEI